MRAPSPFGPALVLVLSVSTACGGDDGGGAAVDASDPGAIDAMAAPSCAAGGPSRAVVLSINGDEDSIEVLGLDGGQLVDRGLRFTSVDNPRDVAIRADGAEAMIAYGGFGQPYGVVVLALGAGGTTATIGQTLQLGTDRRPFGLAYAGADRAVVAMAAGPSGHQLIALDRGGDGRFAAGPISAVPDDWPLVLRERPGAAEVVLARAYLIQDEATDVYLLRRGAGLAGWVPAGAASPVSGTPLDLAIDPDGAFALSASSDPADPVSISNLDGAGLLHVVPLTASGPEPETTVALPGPGSLVAVDPGGRFVLTDSPLFQLDAMSNTPITYERRLFTIARSGGVLGAVQAEPTPWPALLVHGLEIAGSGHVVRARQLYPDQAPVAERYPLEVLLPVGDGSFTTCSTLRLAGQARLAIAP